jgi:hypothetical protein
MNAPSPLSEYSRAEEVFGGTPKTAVGTTALPKATAWFRLSPKSEIETGKLTQSLGHKRIEKTSTDRFGYASIFSIRFCSNILRQLAGLNFGFRAESMS